MLTIEVLNDSLPLASELNSRGLFLMPVENTPLMALVKESIPEAIPNEDTTQGENAVYQIMAAANTPLLNTDVVQHNVVLDEVVPVVAEAVRNVVKLSKTVVIPYVEKLVNDTQESMKQYEASNLLKSEIICFYLPKPMYSPVMKESLERFASSEYDPSYVLDLEFPQLSDEELNKLILSGSAQLDKEINLWLAEKGSGFLSSVWADFFVGQKIKSFHQYIAKKDFNGPDLDRAFAVCQLARNLFDNPPEGVASNLTIYNDRIATLRNIASRRLLIEIDFHLVEVLKLKNIIRHISDKKIYVYGDSYMDFLNAGGMPEVIMGSALLATPLKDADSLLENKDKLINSWNKYCALTNSAEVSENFVRLKNELRRNFRKMILEEMDDAQLNREAAIDNFNKLLNTYAEVDLDCIYTAVVRLVCRSRFSNTDAETVILLINEAAKNNPELPIREAATIGVIQYIAEWVAKQFKVA